MNAQTSAPQIGAAADDGFAAWIAPSRAAVLAIDMQVDFVSPGGVVGGWGVDLTSMSAAIAASGRLVAAARRAGAQVVFIGLFTRPEQDSSAWTERLRRRGGDPATDGALCRTGSPGAAFVGPQPAPGEVVIAKTRYSGFYRTDLDATLCSLGVDTLIVCGVTTECCVDSTVRDAFHRDYHVFIATDACAAYETDLHEAALKSLDLNCAILTDSEQVIAAWREKA